MLKLNNSYSKVLSMPFEDLLSKFRTEIMGVSMILIMLFHQGYINDNFISTWIHFIGYIGVECFLLVSGLGVAYSLSKNTVKQFYINRIRRLFPACLVWGISKCLLSLIPILPGLEESFALEITSISLWYIYASVVFYMISPILDVIINKIGWWTLVIVVSFVFITVAFFWEYNQEAPYLLEKGRWVFKRLPIYILGILFVKKTLNIRSMWLFILGMIAFLINIVLMHYIIVVNAINTPSGFIQQFVYYIPCRHDLPDNGRFVLDMCSVLFLCPLFVMFSKLLEHLHISGFIKWCGTNSLGIYLCHQYIYRIFNDHSTGFSYIDLICALLLSFGVAYLIKYVSSKCLNIFDIMVSKRRYNF